jgi:ATP-dependent protease ClpP protease subunit
MSHLKHPALLNGNNRLINSALHWSTTQNNQRTIDRFTEAVLSIPPARKIYVNVDSEGGSKHIAEEFYYFLKKHPAEKIVTIHQKCCSAATWFILAGHSVRMHIDSKLFLHEGQMYAVGGSTDFRSMANFLENQEIRYRKLFSLHTGLSPKRLKTLMTQNGGTWLCAQEALDLHFINEIIDAPSPVSAEGEGTKTETDSAPCKSCPYSPWYEDLKGERALMERRANGKS